MRSPRHALVILFLVALAASMLFGCRAFEPEAVIVNQPPETYIVGSPAEESGGFFHFRVYWYGTDEDGYVARYAWALTDTSIQDDETDDDEEDQNFDPATNISTLDIATFTTRTDTVFDFRIGQGAARTYDMTLHIAAIDDRGAYDRTPARLHFFSNALDNPDVLFYREIDGENVPFASGDTVAFGDPIFLTWAGQTANAGAFYDQTLLAERDTVAPYDDGLLGFKWRLPDHQDCDQAREDCWNPRILDQATGDSVSVFGDVTGLTFLNDGSGSGVFGRTLEAQTMSLLVNTIDVAGVEVPVSDQLFRIVINYDPDTYILDGERDENTAHNDDLTYPRYYVANGPEAGWYEFTSGDTVPDGAYVLFKALGWDDPRDSIEDPESKLRFQGRFEAGARIRGEGAYYPFSTTYSKAHQTVEWTNVTNPADWDNPSADTLGFKVGPFDYTVFMRAVDEQGTTDGTPDSLSFRGNYAPCVQCIEVGSTTMEPSAEYGGDAGIMADNCYDQTCLAEETEISVYSSNDPNFDETDPSHLQQASNGKIMVNPSSGDVVIDRMGTMQLPGPGWYDFGTQIYGMAVFLHGKDHPREWSGLNVDRAKAWNYQVDYAGDPGNSIQDGGGRDNIGLLTELGLSGGTPAATDIQVDDLVIEPTTGAWGVNVAIAVPTFLMFGGPDYYWNDVILDKFGCEPPAGTTRADTLAWQNTSCVQTAFRAWQLTTAQFTPGEVSAIAIDQASCDARPNGSTAYHFFWGTRVPEDIGRVCEPGKYDDPGAGVEARGMVKLNDFAAYSNDREAVSKPFHVRVYPVGSTDPFVGGVDPPGWIDDGARQISWR